MRSGTWIQGLPCETLIWDMSWHLQTCSNLLQSWHNILQKTTPPLMGHHFTWSKTACQRASVTRLRRLQMDLWWCSLAVAHVSHGRSKETHLDELTLPQKRLRPLCLAAWDVNHGIVMSWPWPTETNKHGNICWICKSFRLAGELYSYRYRYGEKLVPSLGRTRRMRMQIKTSQTTICWGLVSLSHS